MLKELIAKTGGAQGLAGEDDRGMIELLSPLLSAETLTILQLLGFNYKRAVAEPLTDLVAQGIRTRARRPDPTADVELLRLTAEREVAYVELARDEEALARFRSLFPGDQLLLALAGTATDHQFCSGMAHI